MNEKIWLIDMGEDIAWCNEPYPDDGIDYDDSTGYVRMDIHQSLEKDCFTQAKDIENLNIQIEEQKATINLLCNALETLCMDFEDYADPREPFDYKTEIAKHRALAKQHKQRIKGL